MNIVIEGDNIIVKIFRGVLDNFLWDREFILDIKIDV